MLHPLPIEGQRSEERQQQQVNTECEVGLSDVQFPLCNRRTGDCIQPQEHERPAHGENFGPGKRLPVGENTQEVQCQRRAEKRQRKVIQDRAVKLHGEQRLRDAEQVGQAQDTDNKPLREAQTLGLPHRS